MPRHEGAEHGARAHHIATAGRSARAARRWCASRRRAGRTRRRARRPGPRTRRCRRAPPAPVVRWPRPGPRPGGPARTGPRAPRTAPAPRAAGATASAYPTSSDARRPCPAARGPRSARRAAVEGGAARGGRWRGTRPPATTATDVAVATPTPMSRASPTRARCGGVGRDLGMAVHDGDNPARIADAARSAPAIARTLDVRLADLRGDFARSRNRHDPACPRRCRNGGRAVPS